MVTGKKTTIKILATAIIIIGETTGIILDETTTTPKPMLLLWTRLPSHWMTRGRAWPLRKLETSTW